TSNPAVEVEVLPRGPLPRFVQRTRRSGPDGETEVELLQRGPSGRRERWTLPRLLSRTLRGRVPGRPPRRGKDERGVQRTANAPRPSATRVRISPSPPFHW